MSNHYIIFFLTDGSDKSTTISECEVAPIFCTNHTENTRRQEKRASSSSVSLTCLSAWSVRLMTFPLCSWRSADEADTRAEGWVNGLHLPLSEPLLLPSGLWSHATQSSKGLQVRHITASKGDLLHSTLAVLLSISRRGIRVESFQLRKRRNFFCLEK